MEDDGSDGVDPDSSGDEKKVVIRQSNFVVRIMKVSA
jgi:hypothetical protein